MHLLPCRNARAVGGFCAGWALCLYRENISIQASTPRYTLTLWGQPRSKGGVTLDCARIHDGRTLVQEIPIGYED